MYATRIKQIRTRKQISQQELARLVGLSQAEVSRKENGVNAIDLNQLRLFASALGVSVAELLGEDEFKAS